MYAKFFKRASDVTFSLLLILVFSWLILFIVVDFVISFKFPIFFRQLRVGKDSKHFVIYKFRTLMDSVDLPLKDRRFWWGDVLRYFSLDELPQVWNVLKGEMSLIGPRPLPEEYLPLMNEQQRIRHQVRPGITGLVQVNGRHEIPWQKKFELDVYYVKHLSLLIDFSIVLKTIALLTSFRKDKSLSEKKFEGASSSQ
jgi:undecaprenyl phosphate N,N'-diacetylbacillosamine 1-phosphate transferase